MLIFVSCLVIFVYGMLSSLLGTIIPGLGDSLHLTNAEIGYIGLAQGFGLAGMSVLSGALMDRKGKKLGVTAGLCATIAGLLLLTHAASVVSVAAAMLILGCGGSVVIVGANAITSDVGDKRRAAALNFLNIFSGLGGLATPFIAGNFLGANPGRIAGFGIVATVVVLIVVLLIPMAKPQSSTVVRPGEGGWIFKSSALYLLSAVTLLYTACEFGIWNWLPKFLIASGMPSAIALNILSLGFACGLLFGRRRTGNHKGRRRRHHALMALCAAHCHDCVCHLDDRNHVLGTAPDVSMVDRRRSVSNRHGHGACLSNYDRDCGQAI